MKIALIIDSIESEHSQMILAGATSVFDEKEVSVTTYQIGSLIDDQDPFNYQNRSVETLITKENTDGIIFLALPHFHFESNEYLVKYLSQFKDIPVVSIGYINEEIPSVAYSSKECITEIVDHLIQVHGHKRIALFTVDTESKEAQEREDAFREAMKKNGIEYDENLTMIGNYDYDVAMESLMEHKKKFGYDFDAIVSIDDDMAFACVDTLHHEKIKIPEEIAVTGFDNSIRSYSDELGLTTGSQKTKEQGVLAVKMIHDILLGKKIEKHACIQAKAIFRESCGCERNLENDDESKPITTSEWYNQRNQFLSVIKLYTLMQFEMPYSTVRSKLRYELITIGVGDACVCLFEHPMNTKKSKPFELPDKAYVSVAFNSENTVQIGETEATIEFNPRENLVPDGLFNNLDKMIVMALYRFSTLIGYIVFKPGDFDLGVYSLIHKIISNSLVASMKISFVENENKNLHSAVAEATRDSVSDELTELFNRRGLYQFGQSAIDACVAMN
ncbi:MAG: LacI family DNA-binding transcriptional regulator, partial [Treponema sp.]|nr:LacI family DNA-binding transcriptional regulator [Treponema sp.]